MARPAICVLLVCICCLNVACVASETASSETSSDEQQAEVSLSLPAGGSSLQQQQSPQQALAAHPSAARCLGTKGDWCLAFYSQPSVPWDQLQLHGKTCPNNCSSVGVCHADTGLCDCPAGWKGRDCSQRDPRPCTNAYRSNKAGPPASHLNELLRDKDWAAPGFTYSRCLGVCDEDTATCYCDGPTLGRIPPPPGAPPGTPPTREGRLLAGACQRLLTDFKGKALQWVTPVGGRPYDSIYGPRGWCMDTEPLRACPCLVDGYDGPTCDTRTETFCPNQCSGHGECARGFCRCYSGWYGLDCAKKSAQWRPYQPPPPSETADEDPLEDSETPQDGAASDAGALQGPSSSSSAAEAAEAAGSSSSTDAQQQQQQQSSLPEAYWSIRDLYKRRPYMRNITMDPWEASQVQDAGWLSAAQLLINQGILAAGESANVIVPEVYAAPARLLGEPAAGGESGGGSGDGSAEALARLRLQVRLHHKVHRRARQRRQLQRHFWTGGGARMPGSDPEFNTSLAGLPGPLSNWLAASDLSGVSGDALGGGGAAGAQQGQYVGTSVQFAELLLEQGVEGLPAGMRRRPLVYVYDMPSQFVSRQLQYRSNKDTCSWRTWTRSNWTRLAGDGWRYSMESHLHELLLQSPHRTLDPAAADFFYVPVYAACYMEAIAGFADHPWFWAPSDSHVKGGVLMYQAALDWVRTTYPFYNASAGADHIWLFAHDEGACWAPTELARHGILLSHWGRTTPGGNPPGSLNSRASFDYNIDVTDDPAAPRGYRSFFQGHPCYDPAKDLVLPPFRPPQQYHASVYMAGDTGRKRRTLLLFREDVGHGKPPAWSRGLRQEVYALSRQHHWVRNYSTLIGPPAQLSGDQSLLLASSQYCLVAMGEGWSPGFADALLHGCIPVVVEDDIAPPFANMLALKDVTVAIPRSHLKDLPRRLLEIPQEEADAMRHRISQGLWRRMAWLTHPMVRYQAQTVLQGNEQKYPWLKEQRQEELLRFFHGSSGAGGQQAEPQASAAMVSAADGTLQPAAAVEGAEGGAVEGGDAPPSLLPPIWWPREPEDDAFGTLLGWLHHLLLQRQQQQQQQQQATAAGRPQHPGGGQAQQQQQQQQQEAGGGPAAAHQAQPVPAKQHKRQRQRQARVE